MKETLKQKYQSILNILDKVLTSINDGNSTKNDTIYLFLDILLLVKTANSHSDLQYCFLSLCSLFKNCEFPINIDYKTFESDAIVASRLAAHLTALTFNERVEDKKYVTKINIYSLMRLALSESENIYDIKVMFDRSQSQGRLMIHGTKDLKNKGRKSQFEIITINNNKMFVVVLKKNKKKVIEIKDLQQILEDSKNFQWFHKWMSEKKLANYTVMRWNYKMEDLKKGLETSQINMLNQLVYPTTLDLNAQRFVTNITYDCLNGIWNRVVSVPFIQPSGEIRFQFFISLLI